MRLDLDQLDRDVVDGQLRDRDRQREPSGPFRRPSPRSRSVEAQILDRGIAATMGQERHECPACHGSVYSTAYSDGEPIECAACCAELVTQRTPAGVVPRA